MVQAFFAGKWQEAPRLVEGTLIAQNPPFVTVELKPAKGAEYILPAQPMQVFAKRCEVKK